LNKISYDVANSQLDLMYPKHIQTNFSKGKR